MQWYCLQRHTYSAMQWYTAAHLFSNAVVYSGTLIPLCSGTVYSGTRIPQCSGIQWHTYSAMQWYTAAHLFRNVQYTKAVGPSPSTYSQSQIPKWVQSICGPTLSYCTVAWATRLCHNKPHAQNLRSREEWFLEKNCVHMSSSCKLIWDPKSKILFWSVAFSLGLTRSQKVLPVKLKSAHTQKKEHF